MVRLNICLLFLRKEGSCLPGLVGFSNGIDAAPGDHWIWFFIIEVQENRTKHIFSHFTLSAVWRFLRSHFDSGAALEAGDAHHCVAAAPQHCTGEAALSTPVHGYFRALFQCLIREMARTGSPRGGATPGESDAWHLPECAVALFCCAVICLRGAVC